MKRLYSTIKFLTINHSMKAWGTRSGKRRDPYSIQFKRRLVGKVAKSTTLKKNSQTLEWVRKTFLILGFKVMSSQSMWLTMSSQSQKLSLSLWLQPRLSRRICSMRRIKLACSSSIWVSETNSMVNEAVKKIWSRKTQLSGTLLKKARDKLINLRNLRTLLQAETAVTTTQLKEANFNLRSSRHLWSPLLLSLLLNSPARPPSTSLPW